MTRVSTALLTFGPRALAPWGDRTWRVSATAQLIEGSSPYWIVTPTLPAQHAVSRAEVEVAVPNDDCVLDSILLILASHFGDDRVEGFLVESHNLSVGRNKVREVAKFYELVDESRTFLARIMSQTMRIGVVQLDAMTLVNEGVIVRLRELGFDVETFSQPASAAV